MSFSGWLATISRARLRPVGERQLDLGRVGDDVEAGQDVALEVDDDAAAEPAVPVAASPFLAGPFVSIRTSEGWTAW